jgi:hypothetical protein
MTYEMKLKKQPCLGWLVDRRFTAKFGYDPGPVHVRSVVDKVALGQDFVRALRHPLVLPVHQCPISKIFYMLLLPEGPVAKFENGLKSSLTF